MTETLARPVVPTAEERAHKSSRASRGLHHAEGAALPGAIDHLRRQSTQGRAGETAASRESGGDEQEHDETIAQRQ